MNPQSYASGSAFRIALEARLKDRAATEDIDLQRLRRRVAFDRFLSRLAMQNRERWALKGGYALEIELDIARSTRDLDLVLRTSPEDTPGSTPVDTAMAFLRTSAAMDAHSPYHSARCSAQLVGNPFRCHSHRTLSFPRRRESILCSCLLDVDDQITLTRPMYHSVAITS
jgi:hypothetical protein